MPMMRNYWSASYIDPVDGSKKTTDAFEPWSWKSNEYGVGYAGAISDRLKYSRYIYSQMYSAYRMGGSVVRPLFMDYPNDNNSHYYSDSTYMLGDSIKVSPVLTQGKKEGDTFTVWFPQGKWYSLQKIDGANMIEDLTKGGNWVNLKASNT